MDIKGLYTFVAIAEHGSFLAASRALGLSPAAVSLHVKVLEEELGDQLFDRSVRPPVLTDHGRRSLEQARRVVAAWEQLGRHEPPEVGGVLEIGAVPTAVASIVAGGLAELRARHARLVVRLATGASEELEDRVTRGTLDAAVMMPPTVPSLGLTYVPIVREPFVVVAPAGTPAGSDIACLQALPYVRFRRHSSIARVVEGALERRGVRLEPQMEIDSAAGVLALVEAGLGVSILPASQVPAGVAAAISSRPFGEPAVERTLGLLHRPDHPRGPQLQKLMAALRAASAGQREQGPLHRSQRDGEAKEKGDVHAHDQSAQRHLEEAGGSDHG